MLKAYVTLLNTHVLWDVSLTLIDRKTVLHFLKRKQDKATICTVAVVSRLIALPATV